MPGMGQAILEEGIHIGEERERKDMSLLMGYLAENGRTDDIIRASKDESYLDKLLSDFVTQKV